MGYDFGTNFYPNLNMPQFNYNFGMLPMSPMFPSLPSFSTASNNPSLNSANAEEYQRALAKRQKEYREKSAAIFKSQAENKAKYEDLNKNLNLIESSKKEDGSAVVNMELKDYRKELSWGKRALRALSNMGEGIIKIGADFVGYENGKIKIGKLLRNLAIAGGVIALTCIPGVGPVISTALLATGVLAGGFGVTKGIVKASKAESVEELDAAFQNIGGGAFIGVTSAIGLKGLGKGFRVSQLGGNAETAAKGNFLTDMTVNAFKATKAGAEASKAALSDAIAQSNTSKFSTFNRVWSQNTKEQFVTIFSKKDALQKAQQASKEEIQARIGEIDTKLADNTISQAERAQLTSEKKFLTRQNKKFSNAHSKKEYDTAVEKLKKRTDALKKAGKKLNAEGTCNFDGVTLSKSNPDDIKFIETLLKQTKKLSKETAEISKLQKSVIKRMAFRPKKNKTEIEKYLGSTDKSTLSNLWELNGKWKAPFKFAWDAFNLMWMPWSYLQKTDAGRAWNIYEGVNSKYEMSMIVSMLGGMFNTQNLTAEEVKQAEEELKAQMAACETEKARLEKQLKQLSA